jgi:hypothetical protein
MGEMFNPPHPGLILKDTVLREDGGISVKEFAEKLGMTRTAISRVVKVRRQSALSWRYAWRHCSMSLLVRGSRCRSNTICGSYAINGGRRFGA